MTLLLLGVLAAASGADCPQPARRLPEPTLGLVLPLHSKDRSFSYRQQVQEVAATGVNGRGSPARARPRTCRW